jgi:hypothetical protein
LFNSDSIESESNDFYTKRFCVTETVKSFQSVNRDNVSHKSAIFTAVSVSVLHVTSKKQTEFIDAPTNVQVKGNFNFAFSTSPRRQQ